MKVMRANEMMQKIIRMDYDTAGYYGLQYQWSRFPSKIRDDGCIDIMGGVYEISGKFVGQLGSITIAIVPCGDVWLAVKPDNTDAM